MGPTHEEEITRLVSSLVSSYRHLPLRLYQIGEHKSLSFGIMFIHTFFLIGRKYRDELRPRSGLLRAREFVMKDMYTFDASKEDALQTYEEVRGAYKTIFERIGIPFASVCF